MLSSIPLSILVGLICGFLAGLGVGGGSLLMLWLTAVLSVEPQIARGINLMFFIPAALSVSVFRWHQGQIRFRQIRQTVLAGCVAAIAGCVISGWLDQQIMRKLFGGLLLVTGARELFYRRRKDR